MLRKYLLVMLCCMAVLWSHLLHAQDLVKDLEKKLLAAKEAQEKVDTYNDLAQTYYNLGDASKAAINVSKGLALAEKVNYAKGKAESNLILGYLSKDKESYNNALKYYVSAIRTFESLGENRRTANAYEALGALYQKQGLYGLAVNNYQKALKIYEGYRKKSELTSLYESIAFCHTQQRQYKEAITFYNDLLMQYQGGGDDQKVLQIRYELSELYTNSENYAAAIEINQEIAQQLSQKKRVIELSTTYNNLGFLHKRNGNTKNSIEFFYKSLAVYNQNKGRLQGEQKALLLTNTGVAHTNLKAYNKAKNYFEEALKIRQDKNSPAKLADTYNYIASNYYVSGNNSQALTNVNIAIEIGERYKAQSSLLTSYKLLSLIYQQENASSKAEVYRKKFNTLNEQLQREREQKKQELLARQAQLEKEENDYKTLIARQEYQASELNRLAVEAERKEQELTILRKNQELQNERFRNQQLEQERINQLLAITQQKARAEKQQQEIALLQKSKEIQALALKQKEAEQQERNRRIELLEKDKKLKEERLEKERNYRTFSIAAIVGIAAILLIVGYSLLNTKRQNRKINQQKQEIAERNEELLQNQEEIQSQKESLQQANQNLSHSNRIIQESINAGLTIQQAILPDRKILEEVFTDHFILYRPKDVVSGDFYWLDEVDDKIYFAAVDCTGHGVPGAFMSMIGNTLLDKLVFNKKTRDPAKILDTLDEEIQKVLKQEETGNRDGMDVALIKLEKIDEQTRKVTFAGAKRPLYYVRQPEEIIDQLKGDRKSVGGVQLNDAQFTSKELLLKKGDILYLSTDGYVDQNDANRQKIGAVKFLEVISDNINKPLAEQKAILERVLDEHKESAHQRDDILVIGVKL